MQIAPEQLAAHLARGRLARLYTVSGDEPLLAIEAQDAIRAAARAQGYAERQLLHADARWDWSQLAAAAGGLSLFAERRLLELRLPGGKPGKAGGAALTAFARRSDDDGLLALICLPRLDRATRAGEWASALAAAGAWIEVQPVGRERLPAWIAARLARQGQSAPPVALEFIADKVEGNLLAAQQEIAKLGLLHPAGALDLEAVRSVVLDVARYEVFGLPPALLAGDRKRIVRLLAGLRDEGEPLPLLLWAVGEELRSLLRLRRELDSGAAFAGAVRGYRFAGPPAQVERALEHLDSARLADLLGRCAELDRLAKGLAVPGRDSDPWLELTDLALACAPP